MAGQVMSSAPRSEDHWRISSEIGVKVARLVRGPSEFFLSLRDFMPAFLPIEKARPGFYIDTGMVAGPDGGRRSLGSVRDWTCSTVVSGAISRSRRPGGTTAVKARCVNVWST